MPSRESQRERGEGEGEGEEKRRREGGRERLLRTPTTLERE
jgi:hypothetical protein